MKNLDTYIGEGLLTSKTGPEISARETIEAAIRDLAERNSKQYARTIAWEIEEDKKGVFVIEVTCDEELRDKGIIMHDKDVRLLNRLCMEHPFIFRMIENLTLYKLDNGGKWPDWLQGTGFRDLYVVGTYAKTITGFNVTFSYGDPEALGLTLEGISRTEKTPVFKDSMISAPDGFVIMSDYEDALRMFGPGFRIDAPGSAYNKLIINGVHVTEKENGKDSIKDSIVLPVEVTSNIGILKSSKDINRCIGKYVGQWLTERYKDMLRPFSEVYLNIQSDRPIGGKMLDLFTVYYMWDLRNGDSLVVVGGDV